MSVVLTICYWKHFISSFFLLNQFLFSIKVPEVVVPVPVPETQGTETTDVKKDQQTKKNAAKEDGRDGSM